MAIKNKDKYWLRSAALTVLQNMSGVLLGFGSFYLLIRLLTKHEFGAWTLFTATTTILEFIRNGLVQSALIKYLSGATDDERPHVIGASFTISGMLTVLYLILSYSLAVLLSGIWHLPELIPMFLWYNLVFIFSGALTQFQSIEQAGFKFNGIFLSTLIRQGLFFAFVAFASFTHYKATLINLIQVQAVSAILGSAVSFYFIRKIFTCSFRIQKRWMSNLFHYGKYAFGTTISAMLSNSIDQMMLGGLLSAASAGAYNVAVRISNLVEIPTSSIATIVFPQSAQRIVTEGKSAAKYLYEKSVGAVLAILFPGLLFVFIFAPYIVTFIAGQTYADTIPVLRITIIYCLFTPYGRQFGTIVDSIGKPKITFITVIISATINALLNFFLIKTYGVLGAAWATLTSTVIGFIIGQVVLKRELDVNPFNACKYALKFYPEIYRKYVKASFEK
jgi:lipopolysaccharide exporter